MSTFDETIVKLKSEIAGHVAKLKSHESWIEVEKLFTALNTIEGLSDAPKTSLSEIFGFSADGATVRPGEFIGMDPVAAAKKYLEKKQATASSLDEILDAIQKGGAQNTARETLATSLARSTWDVVKAPGQELYTLVKYAPQAKRGRKKSANASEPDAGTAADESASTAGAGR